MTAAACTSAAFSLLQRVKVVDSRLPSKQMPEVFKVGVLYEASTTPFVMLLPPSCILAK